MWVFRFFHEMFPPHFLDGKIIYGKFPGYKNFYAKNYQKNFTNGKRQRQLLFRNHPSLKGKAGSVEIKSQTLWSSVVPFAGLMEETFPFEKVSTYIASAPAAWTYFKNCFQGDFLKPVLTSGNSSHPHTRYPWILLTRD